MSGTNYQTMANNDISASISHLNVHDHLKDLTVPELRAICDADRLPWMSCVLNVTGELNVGTIVRNSLLTGARRVLILGRRKYDKRGTVGSEHYVDVDRITAVESNGVDINPKIFWDHMDHYGAAPIFIEQGGTDLPNVFWNEWILEMGDRIPCLVFGNENRGVPENILQDADRIVSIPQKGVIRSYNVASAAAIVMYDMVTKAGWW